MSTQRGGRSGRRSSREAPRTSAPEERTARSDELAGSRTPHITRSDAGVRHRYQAGEYGEGREQEATGVGPRSARAAPQQINTERGHPDRYGSVAPGRYGVYGYSSSAGYPGSYPREARAPLMRTDHRGRGPKGYVRSDERLRELICERLTEDPDIDASDITVEVSGGKVTLSGSVNRRHTKYEIEQCVENCGAREVENNLQVV